MRFNNRRLLLRFTIICLLLMATIGTAYWVQGHGFIEVDPSSDTDTSYTLLNQKTNASTTVFTKSGIFKKIVAKGTYEIIVGAGDSNYFGMATTKGFMQSTKVKSSLTQESVRRFVGNNPAECMGYTGSALVSYGCNSDYSHLTTHVPATAVTPTYASVDQKSGTRGSVEGIVQTTEGTIVLINVLKTPQNYAFHGVYRLDGGARGPAIPTLLSRPLDLIPDTSYTIKAYKTGFIVYDSNLARGSPARPGIDRPRA